MANADTLKDAVAGKVTAVTVTPSNEVLDPVPAIEWTSEELFAIRAIQRATHTDRKPVTTADVVSDIRKALQSKAKATFYAPFETEYKNSKKADGRMGQKIEYTPTEYMHKAVSKTGWKVLTDLNCKLDVVPPQDTPKPETEATPAK